MVLLPKDGLFHLQSELFRLHVVVSQEQIPNAKTTPGINSRHLICLIDDEIATEFSTSVHETVFKSVVQLFIAPLKNSIWMGVCTLNPYNPNPNRNKTCVSIQIFMALTVCT